MNVGEGPGVGAETTQEKHTLSRIQVLLRIEIMHTFAPLISSSHRSRERCVEASESVEGDVCVRVSVGSAGRDKDMKRQNLGRN